MKRVLHLFENTGDVWCPMSDLGSYLHLISVEVGVPIGGTDPIPVPTSNSVGNVHKL